MPRGEGGGGFWGAGWGVPGAGLTTVVVVVLGVTGAGGTVGATAELGRMGALAGVE